MAGKKSGSYEILSHVQPEDLVTYGFIPELVGSIPVLVALEELDKEAFIKISFPSTQKIYCSYAEELLTG